MPQQNIQPQNCLINNDFKQQINESKSRFDIDMVVAEALQNPKRITDLYHLTTHSDRSTAMHAAWALTHCAVRDIETVNLFKNQIIKDVWQQSNESVKRSYLKILSLLPLCEEMDGQFFDQCLNGIIQSETSIASKAYTIDILLKYASVYPDLIPEINQTLKMAMPGASKGVSNKIKNIVKKLSIQKANS